MGNGVAFVAFVLVGAVVAVAALYVLARAGLVFIIPGPSRDVPTGTAGNANAPMLPTLTGTGALGPFTTAPQSIAGLIPPRVTLLGGGGFAPRI